MLPRYLKIDKVIPILKPLLSKVPYTTINKQLYRIVSTGKNKVNLGDNYSITSDKIISWAKKVYSEDKPFELAKLENQEGFEWQKEVIGYKNTPIKCKVIKIKRSFYEKSYC